MEIIAVFNIKGGVGKTTTAVNLGFRSAAEGWPTLLWDLDPQGAASYLLRRRDHVDGGSKAIVSGDTALEDVIVPSDYALLDLLPADFSYRRMDMHLHRSKRPSTRLRKLMRTLEHKYASLILDCAPGMSLVAENVIRAASALVVPLPPSPLAMRTLEQLLEFLARKGWGDTVVLPFFSMVDRRKAAHKAMVESLRERFPLILDAEVPYGVQFERMTLRRAPLEAYAPASFAADVYRSLWREIDGRLQAAGVPHATVRAASDVASGEDYRSSAKSGSSSSRGKP